VDGGIEVGEVVDLCGGDVDVEGCCFVCDELVDCLFVDVLVLC